MPLLGGVWETNVAHSRILDTPPPALHNAHTVHYSVKAHLSSEVDKKSKEKRSPPNQTVSGPTLPTLPHIYINAMRISTIVIILTTPHNLADVIIGVFIGMRIAKKFGLPHH